MFSDGMQAVQKGETDMFENIIDGLRDFLAGSHSSFHAVKLMKDELRDAGFAELFEDKKWNIQKGKGYFVTRNSSSLIAFYLPEGLPESIHIAAAHSDSPSFKIKPAPEMDGAGGTVRLNIEKYGGMLTSTWFDRPLGIAGRVLVKQEESIREVLVDMDKDCLVIPSLAIHMDRESNDKGHGNVQTEMPPLFGDEDAKGAFIREIAAEVGADEKAVLACDLYLTVRSRPSVWGTNREFISAQRLDDLECVYCCMQGLKAACAGGIAHGVMPVLAVFDNEEVGSRTRQGAGSDLLVNTLRRVCEALNMTHEEQQIMAARSFMISADNAHAVHPNYPDKADPVNRPQMNRGIVLKHHAGQKYTTDAVSAAIIRDICEKHDIPVQEFTNRSDMNGGSTLGNISGTQLSVRTADIGLAQLAMHSCWETAGTKDPGYLARLAGAFFEEGLPETVQSF